MVANDRGGERPALIPNSDRPAADQYQSGFGNEFATEALPGALPARQNSPQKCPYGLYAEQISGTAFTAPRGSNRRTWLYRIRPAAQHKPFVRIDNGRLTNDFGATPSTPNQLRWDPLPVPESPTDFVTGLATLAGNGDPCTQTGCGIHVYVANQSMGNRVFYNADAEMLIVPQLGRLRFVTELGLIDAEPREIELELTDAAKDQLAQEGYSPEFGARPLKRAIQKRVQNQLADEILAAISDL